MEDQKKQVVSNLVQGMIMEEYERQNIDTENNDVTVRIGLVGATGVGKSSLVNALRGIPDNFPAASPTGNTETTTQPTEYHAIETDKVIFVDIPGISSTFPFRDYWNKMNFRDLDVVILVQQGRSNHEHDVKLIQMLQASGKVFCVFRNKLDCEIMTLKYTNQSLETLLQTVRRDYQSSMYFGVKCFHGSAFQTGETTWNQLHEMKEWIWLESSQQIKSQLLKTYFGRHAAGARGVARGAYRHIWFVAASSACTAVIPVPGISAGGDLIGLVWLYDRFSSAFKISGSDTWKDRLIKMGAFAAEELADPTLKTLVQGIKAYLDENPEAKAEILALLWEATGLAVILESSVGLIISKGISNLISEIPIVQIGSSVTEFLTTFFLGEKLLGYFYERKLGEVIPKIHYSLPLLALLGPLALQSVRSNKCVLSPPTFSYKPQVGNLTESSSRCYWTFESVDRFTKEDRFRLSNRAHENATKYYLCVVGDGTPKIRVTSRIQDACEFRIVLSCGGTVAQLEVDPDSGTGLHLGIKTKNICLMRQSDETRFTLRQRPQII